MFSLEIFSVLRLMSFLHVCIETYLYSNGTLFNTSWHESPLVSVDVSSGLSDPSALLSPASQHITNVAWTSSSDSAPAGMHMLALALRERRRLTLEWTRFHRMRPIRCKQTAPLAMSVLCCGCVYA